jgi:hypothetical protein
MAWLFLPLVLSLSPSVCPFFLSDHLTNIPKSNLDPI